MVEGGKEGGKEEEERRQSTERGLLMIDDKTYD